MVAIDENLAFAPATELKELIRNKTVSPVEITKLYLDRIDRLDNQLNSYLTVTPELAMESAQKAEKALFYGDKIGSLHGIPISLKDLQMTKGIRTTGGSLAYKERIPVADCAVAEKLLSAGAIILGKTNTPEFGLLGANENKLGDSCRNPWNPERTSGGSSGGAAASIIAGLTSLATGSDGGGSIRIPASFNGTYGIKPTQGRISNFTGTKTPPNASYTSQQGPLTRTVKDSALMMQILSGYDSRDPGSLRAPVPNFMAALEKNITGFRIGWSPDFGYTSVDSEVAEITKRSTKVFSDLGCTIDESTLKLENPFDPWLVLFSIYAYVSNGHLLDDPSDPLTWYGKWAMEQARKVTATDYAKALGLRNQMIHQFEEEFEKFDVLVSPTMPTTAFPEGQYPQKIGGQDPYPSPEWGFVPFTHPINTIGFTAASIPCGFDTDGMPVGLHIVGKHGDEESVLAVSAAFEEAQPWIHHRPQVS